MKRIRKYLMNAHSENTHRHSDKFYHGFRNLNKLEYFLLLFKVFVLKIGWRKGAETKGIVAKVTDKQIDSVM